MTKYKQTVAIYVDVVVEAEDEYAADRLIADMSYEEVMASTSGHPYVVPDENELPEKW